MLALYIIAGLTALISALLLLPVCITVKYDGDAEVKLRYLFFKLSLMPPKTEKVKKAQEELEEYKEEKKFLKNFIGKYSFTGAIKEICEIIKVLFNRAAWLFKKLKFRDLYLDISVAGPNAAFTAIEYGAVCAAVYPMLAFVAANADMKTKSIDIVPDYNAKESKLLFDTKIKCKLIWAIIAMVSVINVLVKREIISINKNKKPERHKTLKKG